MRKLKKLSDQTKVRMPPEKVELLKKKYGLEDSALQEIMGSLELEGGVKEEGEGKEDENHPRFPSILAASEMDGFTKFLFYQYLQDERRERRQPPITPKEIAEAVLSALPKQGAGSPITEPPDWAKRIMQDQQTIMERLNKEEREKREKELIEKATEPALKELEKERANVQQLQKEVEELKKPPPTPPRSELDIFFEQREKLKKEGILKEPEPGSVVLGEGGVPISGNIPAWAVYGPKLADDIIKSVTTGIENVASKFRLTGREGAEELITLPSKPTPVRPYPPLTTVKPPAQPVTPPVEVKPEAPAPQAPGQQKLEVELIQMPKRPEVEAEVKPEAEPEAKPEAKPEKPPEVPEEAPTEAKPEATPEKPPEVKPEPPKVEKLEAQAESAPQPEVKPPAEKTPTPKHKPRKGEKA